MRVIEKSELPAGPFFVKLPASPWFPANLEGSANTFLVKVTTEMYSPQHRQRLVRDAALAGWLWNTSQSEAGAREFWVSEAHDTEMRQLLRRAGQGSRGFTMTLRDGRELHCTLADFPHTTDAKTFRVTESNLQKTIEWFDVVQVVIDAE